jgi:hypothetical protein
MDGMANHLEGETVASVPRDEVLPVAVVAIEFQVAQQSTAVLDAQRPEASYSDRSRLPA